jgi:cytochrome c nitrite reductase small subunit
LYKKWGLRALILVGAVVSMFLVFATALQVPAVGKVMGAPETCGTCHVMTYEVETLQRSAHRDLSCLECHSAQGYLHKAVDELETASRHLWVFTTGQTPDVIKPNQNAKEIIQANCATCHKAITGQTHVETQGRFCFDCHRDTPHGRPLRN